MKTNLSYTIALTGLAFCAALVWWKNKPSESVTKNQRPKLNKMNYNSTSQSKSIEHLKLIKRAKGDLPQEELQMIEEQISKITSQKNVGDGVDDQLLASITEIEQRRQQLLRDEINLSEAEIVSVFNIRLKYQAQIDQLSLEHDGHIPNNKISVLIEKRESELAGLLGASTLLRLNDLEKSLHQQVLQASSPNIEKVN